MLYVSPVSVPPSEVRQILDQGAGQHVRQAADGGQPVQHLDDSRIRRCPATGTGIFWGPSGRSQVGVIVERGSRFVQLVALPDRAKTVMASAGNLLVEVLRLGLEQLMEAELLSRPPDVRRSGSSVETCTCIGCPLLAYGTEAVHAPPVELDRDLGSGDLCSVRKSTSPG